MTILGIFATGLAAALAGLAILAFLTEGEIKESDVMNAKAFIGWYVCRDLRWKEAIKVYEQEYDVKIKPAALDVALKELGL